MHVAVFRAEADGLRTAARLRDMGHDAVLAPVFEIAPTGARVPVEPFDAVIFTSAHGADALTHVDASRLASALAFCVGDRTAERAAAVGFAHRRSAGADAARLAAVVQAELPAASRLLLVAGRDRKPLIEERLKAAGFTVAVTEIYKAEGRSRWPDEVERTLIGAPITSALHYSRRSASLALACAAAGGAATRFARWRHHCLSADAAAPLRAAGLPSIVEADTPNEASLLQTL